MSTPLEDQLRTELREEAVDVDLRPGYVATTVQRVLARRRRRQVGVVATAAAIAAVLATGGIALGTESGDGADAPAVDRRSLPTPDHTPSAVDPSPPQLDLADIQRPPGAVSAFPWRDSTLPRILPVGVASAPALSKDPVDHALALVGGPGTSVGVVGDDGRLRRLDGVTLEPPRDPSGYGSSPVKQGSLTPDGSRAAFPQPGAVVIVGRPRERCRILDTADGSVEDAPYAEYRSTYAPDGTGLQVFDTATGPGASQLVRWDEDSAFASSNLSVWYGSETPPSANDRYLLLAGTVHDPGANAYVDGWTVIDIETGTPVSMLRAGPGWYDDGLFGLHTWLEESTVLIQAQDYILAWTPDTGDLERVTESTSYNISLATDALHPTS